MSKATPPCSQATGNAQARMSRSLPGQSSPHPRRRNTETRHARGALQQEDSGPEGRHSQSCSRLKGDGRHQTTRQGPTPGGSSSERFFGQSAESDPQTVLDSCESEPIGDGADNTDGCSIKRLNNIQRAAILRILIEHEADYAKDCLQHGFCSRQCSCFWGRMANRVTDQLGWAFPAALLKRRMTEVLIRMSRKPGGDNFTQDLRESVHRWEAIMARHEQRLDYRMPSEKGTSASGPATFDMQLWSKSIRNAVETDLATVNDPFLDDDERVRSLLRLVVIQRRASLDAVPRNNPGLGRTILELAAALGLRESRVLRTSVGDLADGVLNSRDEDQDTGDGDQESRTNAANSDSTTQSEANTPHGAAADDHEPGLGEEDSVGQRKRKKDKKKKAKKPKRSSGRRESINNEEQEASPVLHSEETTAAGSILEEEEEEAHALTRKDGAAPTGCNSDVLGVSSPPSFVPLPSPPAAEGGSLSEPSTSWSTSPSPGQAGRYHYARSVDLGHSPGMFVTPTPIPTGPRSMSQKRRYSTTVSPNERAWKRQRTDEPYTARTPGMGSPATTQAMTPRGTSSERSGVETEHMGNATCIGGIFACRRFPVEMAFSARARRPGCGKTALDGEGDRINAPITTAVIVADEKHASVTGEAEAREGADDAPCVLDNAAPSHGVQACDRREDAGAEAVQRAANAVQRADPTPAPRHVQERWQRSDSSWRGFGP
ncbi:uncharacterized protein E0L32_011025 [Thyridium curvatum]|uniref:Uncharacterized protein n=1 Tax=Thyridium curvatum TaxID=1093900 RepID=A0A507AJL4_9PEZI|nr:uncharacterized protein E0L32_011025 [Thyridium curvatum]TPX07037.1 hypothetical protein E0L32_011025 [Thyridium curvatum]